MSNLSFGASWLCFASDILLIPSANFKQATDIIQAQKVFYGIETTVVYQILLALTMQLFGLGLAGLAYRFIVEPSQKVRLIGLEHRGELS